MSESQLNSRRGPSRRLIVLIAYSLVLGGIASALLVTGRGIGGSLRIGAWIYIGVIISAVTFAIATLIDRLSGDRTPALLVTFAVVAGVIGVLVGEWAFNNTMGGPT